VQIALTSFLQQLGPAEECSKAKVQADKRLVDGMHNQMLWAYG
jgi:hypothetical protein